MGPLLIRRPALLAFVALAAACTVHDDKVPSLTGPSEFGQSVSITATPDSISQDGASQSAIVVFARGPNGAGLPGVSLRLQIVVGGAVQDYGTLSAKTIATGPDGRASSVYTAPPPPPPPANGLERRVSIVVTATGSNFQTAVSQTADIRLVPTGIILPPAQTPRPSFTYSPQPALVNLPVNFDASATCGGSGCAAAGISNFQWNFGDGSTGTGQRTTKTFDSSGSFNVTLTATSDRGVSASTPQFVTVGTGTEPTADFVFSPGSPQVLQVVSFNATGSRAAGGRTIDRYDWDFGDGVTKRGSTTTHDFSTAGDYTVVLTVTDDLGLKGTKAVTVNVSAGGSGGGGTPTATYVFSPTQPQVGQVVQFNADTSRAGSGHTLVSYGWNFGDGAVATGSTATHAYSTDGTYNVVLTVTDEAGQRGTISQAVTVTALTASLPSASYVFSPSAPGVNETVFFNASTSSGGQGHTITSYAWTFGDGALGAGITVNHAYATSGGYSVVLTVTNDIGQTATSQPQTIAVGGPPAPEANFTFSPNNPPVGQQVVFDASTSTTAQGQTIVDVAWNYGDGTAVVHCGGVLFPNDPSCVNVPATNRISAHTYQFASIFTVNLVVTDSAGRTDAAQPRQITVVPPNPTAVLLLAKTGGNSIQADGSGSFSTGSSTIANYRFIWGDSTPDTSSASSSVSHTFLLPGIHTVTLVVTDNLNRTGATSVDITTP
jgi:PKD repeat protein